MKDFLFIDEQKNVNNGFIKGFNNIETNNEYRREQVFMREFQLNKYFDIKTFIKLIKFDS